MLVFSSSVSCAFFFPNSAAIAAARRWKNIQSATGEWTTAHSGAGQRKNNMMPHIKTWTMLWHLMIAPKDFHLNKGKALIFEWQVQEIPRLQNWSLYVFASGVALPDLGLAQSCKVVHWHKELPVELCQNVLLMICTSFWRRILQRACIEYWKLIGASAAPTM